MDLNYTIYTKVEGGTFKRNRSKLKEILRGFEGKEIEISVRKKRVRRSTDQNALFHVLVRMCAKEWGYRDAELKEALKREFCTRPLLDEHGNQRFNKHGVGMEYVQNTSAMTRSEMAELCDQIYQYAVEEGFVIPPRDKQIEISL